MCPRCKRRDWDSPRPKGARGPRSARAGSSSAERFAALAAEWKRDTEHVSSLTRMVLHPAYQRIVGMGPAALPFLFHALEREPDWWFSALSAITGEDPVPPEARGNLDAMTAAWRRWRRDRGRLDA